MTETQNLKLQSAIGRLVERHLNTPALVQRVYTRTSIKDIATNDLFLTYTFQGQLASVSTSRPKALDVPYAMFELPSFQVPKETFNAYLKIFEDGPTITSIAGE